MDQGQKPMKDAKSIWLLVVSVLLILVSFALLWTWGYQFSQMTKDKSGTVYILKDSTVAARATRDSLQKAYAMAVDGFNLLNTSFTRADSMQSDLEIKLSDFYRLREEITDLLQNPSSTADLDLARKKIEELQTNLLKLSRHSSEVEKENKKLQGLLVQIQQERGNPAISPATSNAGTKMSASNSGLSRSSDAILFDVSEMKLAAMRVHLGREMETLEAGEAEKMTGSFVVKNSQLPLNSAELYVVVLQPDGKVLQNSAWDAGAFQTREGRKIYSCKLRFDYSKGEAKKLNFTLSGDSFKKGNYTLQLYQQGVLVAKANKTLI